MRIDIGKSFKVWLESTEEQHSSEMTEKLCAWIKANRRKPRAGTGPILSGSPIAGPMLSYDIDLEENQLGNFLKEKIKSRRIFPSDILILRKHQMEGLFDKKTTDAEQYKEILRDRAFEKIRKLAEFYKKNGRLPGNADRKVPESLALVSFLSAKRQAYKRPQRNKTDHAKHEGEKEYGISLGLPDNWLEVEKSRDFDTRRKLNDLNIQKVAEYYRKNGRYPHLYSKDPEVRKMGAWLGDKRASYRAHKNGKKHRTSRYEGEKELGISLGLPEDWLRHI